MLELGLVEVTIFFTTAIICIIFVVTWIVNAERKRNICKEEIKRLKNHIETAERETFILTERMENLNTAAFAPQGINETPAPQKPKRSAEDGILLQEMTKTSKALEEENKELKAELEEARNSLEEVYKALVKQE